MKMKTKVVPRTVLGIAVLGLMTLTHGPVLFAAGDDLRLLDAVQRHDREAVRTLLTQRVDVNATRGDGMAPLAAAVQP